MKKNNIFILMLVIAALLSCTMPNSIEIKGNPSLNIPVELDFSSLFSGFLNDGIKGGDNMVIKPCPNAAPVNGNSVITYIMRVPIFEYSIPLGDAPTIGVPLTSDFVLLDTNDASKPGTTLPLDFGGLDNFIDGFTLSGVKASVYFGGSGNLMNLLKVDIINNGTTKTLSGNYPSGLGNGDTYNETDLPDPSHTHSADFTSVITSLLNGHGDTEFGFKVYVPSGSTISPSSFNNSHITAELVIWLPLSLTATRDTEFVLMDMSDREDDLFGREDPRSSNPNGGGAGDILTSLNLKIYLSEGSPNPFSGAKINISKRTDTGDLTSLVSFNMPAGNYLQLEIDRDAMDIINDPDNYPFAPVISVSFNNGSTLSIPRTLKTSRLEFTAGISYKIDLTGGAL
jgi:hypothetical protein